MARPRNSETKTDWNTVQALWEAGSSIGSICRTYVVTPRAISYRAETRQWDGSRRQGSLETRPRWQKKKEVVTPGIIPSPNPVNNSPPQDPTPQEEQEGSSHFGWAQTLLRVSRPLWGDGFPLGDVARCLDAMCRAMPFGMACELVGVPERTMLGYRQREPRLDSQFRRARALAADVAINKIMGDRDWRAAAWLLERGIARAEFKQEDAGTGQEKLVIEIRVSRDEKIAAENGVVMLEHEPQVIDLTPDAGVDMTKLGPEGTPHGNLVTGLPALPEAEDLPRGSRPADHVRGSGGGR